jgi:hypothetical protein
MFVTHGYIQSTLIAVRLWIFRRDTLCISNRCGGNFLELKWCLSVVVPNDELGGEGGEFY